MDVVMDIGISSHSNWLTWVLRFPLVGTAHATQGSRTIRRTPHVCHHSLSTDEPGLLMCSRRGRTDPYKLQSHDAQPPAPTFGLAETGCPGKFLSDRFRFSNLSCRNCLGNAIV